MRLMSFASRFRLASRSGFVGSCRDILDCSREAAPRLKRTDLCGSMYTIHHPSDQTCLQLRSQFASKPTLKSGWRNLQRVSRSFLAAEALNEYLDVNEWQVAGVRKAMGSLDRGESIPHEQVKAWVNSWSGKRERPAPRRLVK